LWTAVQRLRLLRPFAALAAIYLIGCSAPLPSTELPPGREVAPALEFPDLRDYRGIFDLRIRDANLDQGAVADQAKSAQIDFIMIGDRARPGATDYGIGGFTSAILFIPGASFPVDGGDIIAINPRAPIDLSKPSGELVGAIHDQGGVAIAAGPSEFKSAGDYALADGIEIYNQNAAWKAENQSTLYWRAVFLSTDRFLLGLVPRPDQNLENYDKLASASRVTLVAGMGAPDNLTVAGSKVGTLAQLFLFYTTHLLSPERSIDPIVDALKRGHAYVSFDILGYVGEFAFFARDGETKTMMGEEVHLTPSLKLQAELPGSAEKIVLLRDGEQASATENAQTLEFAPIQSGTYRLEAYRKGHLWILSNPVYVR
jgi:hypothetical protein